MSYQGMHKSTRRNAIGQMHRIESFEFSYDMSCCLIDAKFTMYNRCLLTRIVQRRVYINGLAVSFKRIMVVTRSSTQQNKGHNMLTL